jgi:hypothetical protein
LRRRPVRGLGYLFVLLAGVVQVLAPSRLVVDAVHGMVWVWAGFLVIGGIGGLYSTIRNTWSGEYVGAPAVGFAFFFWSAAAFSAVPSSNDPITTVAFGTALLGMTCLLAARWQEVSQQREYALEAKRLEAQQEEEPDVQ